jgi:hypothetical protein
VFRLSDSASAIAPGSPISYPLKLCTIMKHHLRDECACFSHNCMYIYISFERFCERHCSSITDTRKEKRAQLIPETRRAVEYDEHGITASTTCVSLQFCYGLSCFVEAIHKHLSEPCGPGGVDVYAGWGSALHETDVGDTCLFKCYYWK